MSKSTKGQEKHENGEKEQGKPRLTPEQWREERHKKSERNDLAFISRRTYDQFDFIGLLNSHDIMLHKLRLQAGRSRKLSFAVVAEIIEKSDKIKGDINLLNAQISRLLGERYMPPRGFDDPLAKTGQDADEAQPAKKPVTEKKSVGVTDSAISGQEGIELPASA